MLEVIDELVSLLTGHTKCFFQSKIWFFSGQTEAVKHQISDIRLLGVLEEMCSDRFMLCQMFLKRK